MNPSSETLLEQSAFVHRLAAALLRDAHLAEDLAQDALLAGLLGGARAISPRGWLAVATTVRQGFAERSDPASARAGLTALAKELVSRGKRGRGQSH